jgi:NAD-dependent deacetylase
LQNSKAAAQKTLDFPGVVVYIKVMELAEIVSRDRRCVVITGSGVSAESGIPTFRGEQGLWKQYQPEELATAGAFQRNPGLVWEWYNWRRGIIGKAEPNAAHCAIAVMEQFFADFALITQNIDGLHQRAGSRSVLELHGNIWRNKCFECGKKFGEIKSDEPLQCKCGGFVRPDVVWFGESLDRGILSAAFQKASGADLCFVIGTSGVVQPAASIPYIAKENGSYIIEINLERTPISSIADFFIERKAAEMMEEMKEFWT